MFKIMDDIPEEMVNVRQKVPKNDLFEHWLNAWRVLFIIGGVVRIVPFVAGFYRLKTPVKRKPDIDRMDFTENATRRGCRLSKTTYLDLPAEVWFHIMRDLDINSLMNLSQTNLTMRKLILEDDVLWKRMLCRDFSFRRISLKKSASIGDEEKKVFESPYMHHYKIKYITYKEFYYLRNLRRRSNITHPKNVPELIEMEFEQTGQTVLTLIGFVLKMTIATLLFPVHLLHNFLYGRYTRFGRLQGRVQYQFQSTLEALIVDLVEQSQIHYRHLRFFDPTASSDFVPLLSTPYSWALFTLLTLTATPLVIGDIAASVMAFVGKLLVHILLLDVTSRFSQSSLYVRAAAKTLSMGKAVLFSGLLLVYQGTTITAPYLLHVNGVFDNLLWNPNQRYDFVDTVLIMPIIQLIWIGLVHLTAQERILQYLHSEDRQEVFSVLMAPVWLWTFLVRTIVQAFQLIITGIFTIYIMGATALNYFT